jgi:hypothetical protein
MTRRKAVRERIKHNAWRRTMRWRRMQSRKRYASGDAQ